MVDPIGGDGCRDLAQTTEKMEAAVLPDKESFALDDYVQGTRSNALYGEKSQVPKKGIRNA